MRTACTRDPNNTAQCIHHLAQDKENKIFVLGIFGLGSFDPIKRLEAAKIVAPLKAPIRKTGKIFLPSWDDFCKFESAEENLSNLDGSSNSKLAELTSFLNSIWVHPKVVLYYLQGHLSDINLVTSAIIGGVQAVKEEGKLEDLQTELLPLLLFL